MNNKQKQWFVVSRQCIAIHKYYRLRSTRRSDEQLHNKANGDVGLQFSSNLKIELCDSTELSEVYGFNLPH